MLVPNPTPTTYTSVLLILLFIPITLSHLESHPNSERETAELAEMSLDELLEVEVSTTGKIHETIRDTPASVYLVTRSDIEKQGHGNLTEIFENVPGMYNINNYEGVSGNFGMRGYWNGRSQNSSVAILVNGIPQTRMDLYSNPMEMLNLPVQAIDRIEVIHGPNSVIYGNGASFGAINIITDESFFHDQIVFSYGSRGTQRSAIRWSALNANSHFIINAGQSRSDGVGPRLSELIDENGQQELPFIGIVDPNASLDGRLEQQSQYLHLSGGWKDLYFDYAYNSAESEFFLVFPPVSEGNLRETNNYRLTAGWDAQLDNELSIDTRVTIGAFDIEQEFDALTPDFLGVNTLEYDSIEIESLLRSSPTDSISLIAGVNWQRMSDLREYTLVPVFGLENEVVEIDKRDIQSVFSQISYDATEKWRLIGGFRWEEQPAFDRVGYTNILVDEEPTFGLSPKSINNFTPRFSLIYQKSDAEVIKFMAGDAIKLAAFQVDVFQPERTRTLEAAYIRSDERTLYSLSLFSNTLKNLIIEEVRFLPDGSVDTEPRPGGEIDTFGLEGLVKRKINDYWSAELAATWQNSSDRQSPGLSVAYSPKLVSHAKLLYRQNNVSFSLLGRFVDDMESFFDVSMTNQRNTLGNRIGARVDSYTSLDANLRFDNVVDRFYVALQATNFLDEEIRYPNNPFNSTRLNRGTLGYGRRFQLSIGLDL